MIVIIILYIRIKYKDVIYTYYINIRMYIHACKSACVHQWVHRSVNPPVISGNPKLALADNEDLRYAQTLKRAIETDLLRSKRDL
jgi:hypothetical protein